LRIRDEEHGFTLVELAVVTVVLGVLIAIALPSILGFQKTANEVRVRAALINVAKAEAGIAVLNGAYTADAARLAEMVPGIDIGNATDGSVRVVVGDIAPGDSQQVLLYARDVNGSWFGVRLVGIGAESGRHTCRSDAEADLTLAFCSGTDW
jgi:type IV pilus assembly protein PilA